MQFKHPELLYALFLLLIPIIIHLFQLRKFQKVDFTNVAFLKKVTLQTRKSSQLKKWVTLLARMLALACLIFAFAQPFTASKTALNNEKETVLYIDNSFSMQAKGANGPLLQSALQKIYEETNGTEKMHWFTNTEVHKNVTPADFKSEVLDIDYRSKQYTLEEVLLQAKQLFSKSPSAEKRLILVSDFQQNGEFPIIEEIKVDAVALEPVTSTNIAIDTAYILSKNANTTQLSVVVSGQGELPPSLPVALYNEDILIAKTAIDFSEETQNTLTFDVENPEGFRGELRLTDPHLLYDNTLYFSINTPQKIKILSINQGEAGFLQRLFPQNEYMYSQQRFGNINYNDIPSQNFIILNNIEIIPASLVNSIKAFSQAGGSVAIIPALNADIPSYNNLLQALELGNFNEKVNQEKKITKINFGHPLYANVFEKQVANFQYPVVNSFYKLSSNATKTLSFEDGQSYLVQRGNTYVSTASFASENSNFINSPLIVPTFINIAQQSLPLPKLYYQIGSQNTFAVPVKLAQDDILKIKDSLNSFIPLQQTKANSVEITTVEDPLRSGNFSIEKENTFIENVSYNYPRTESTLRYVNPENWEGVTVHTTISDLFDTIANENKIHSFWKWFVIFAILFLLLEMIILKFLKN